MHSYKTDARLSGFDNRRTRTASHHAYKPFSFQYLPPDPTRPGKPVPCLMLCGHWLEEQRVEMGCGIHLEAFDGSILLRVVDGPDREALHAPPEQQPKPMEKPARGAPKRSALVRTKVDPALRARFHGAAWRAQLPPSEVLRQLMQEYVELQSHFDVVHGFRQQNPVQPAAREVSRRNPPPPPVFVYEDDDEETVARKEGWWTPALAEDPMY